MNDTGGTPDDQVISFISNDDWQAVRLVIHSVQAQYFQLMLRATETVYFFPCWFSKKRKAPLLVLSNDRHRSFTTKRIEVNPIFEH